MKTFLCAVCAIAVLHGADPPKFETASVKRMERGVIHNSMGPGIVTLRGDPLKVVLTEAFKLRNYQIVGPAWLDEDCFEIVAKMPEGATSDQIPAMLQALLVERFKLAAHKENRPAPVYALVVDKDGPKFKEASPNFKSMGSLRPGLVFFRSGKSDVQGFKGALTMAKVASFLSGSLGRPVHDLTGLTGTYDIDLAWVPEQSPAAMSGDAATLFTAIRESLGLRLEARKEPVEMLVIDHVERIPTEN